MNLGLNGNVAVVATASSGLGLATAEELANEGCRLSVFGRGPRRLERAVDRLRSTGAQVLARATDVTDCADAAAWVAETAQHFQCIDVLVTNCGGVATAPSSAITPKDFDDAFDRVLLPSISLVTAALPYLRRSRAGQILMLASEAIVRNANTFRAVGRRTNGARALLPHARTQIVGGEHHRERARSWSTQHGDSRSPSPRRSFGIRSSCYILGQRTRGLRQQRPDRR